MPDRRRIVTLSPGGRPILEIDVEVAANYLAIKDTFAYVPGSQNQQASREPGRYGGSVVVGEANDNGTVSWQAFIRGSTADQAAGNIEALIQACNRTGRSRLLEWRPDGSTYSSYFRIAGPASWKLTYSWTQWKDGPGMLVDVSFPVRPLVNWDPMTIIDSFDINTLADYTFDALTPADLSIPGGAGVSPAGAANASERRVRHTVRGYVSFEGQATIKSTPGATITGYKAGVTLRGSAANTYVEVYVDDNGTNSRLRIDTLNAGTRTNRASVNLGSRVSNGTPFWVRARIVGGITAGVVFAEHFTSAPTATGTPATVSPSGGAGYTLVGGDGPVYNTQGFAGWSWVPQNAGATLDDFELRPYIRTGITTPAVTRYPDLIPGTAPALMDVSIAQAATTAKAFAMVAWAPQNPSGTINSVGILDSTAAATHAGLTEGAQATAYGGSDARTTSVSGGINVLASTAMLKWSLISQSWAADDFADDSVDLEIWARLVISATIVHPRASVAISTNGSVEQYSIENGAKGRVILPPTGTPGYVFTRLGLIPIDVSFASGYLALRLGCDSGSSGTLGADYVQVVPARRRAASPTGVPQDASYPMFNPGSVAGVQRTIRNDLSGTYAVPPTAASRMSGLGGELLQPPPGFVDLLVDAHTEVPDDSDGGVNDGLGDPVTTMLDIVPRSFLLRNA